MATELNDIYRGDYEIYKISLPDFDLSADSFFLAVKVNADDADADAVYQIKKVPPHDVAHDTLKIDDPTNGIVYIPVPAANNALLTVGEKYWIGFQWIRGGDKPKTLHVQKFKCLQDINIDIA